MVGLAFWLPGLMMPIISWAAYPRDIVGNIGLYVAMSIFACVVGGALGAFLVGPAAYLVGVIFLAPMRFLERRVFHAALPGVPSGGRWSRIANTAVAVPALLAAAITVMSALFYAGMLIHGGAIRLLDLFR
jgi:hypothetical protein